MLIHSVYFWLKEGLSEEEIADFQRGMKSLKDIATVRYFHAGPPAATDRPVIDSTYSYGMVMLFDDRRAHDLYQDDEIHDAFRQNCSQYWSKVLIYDFTE